VELSFVVNALRRYWWIFILATALGGGTALAVTDRGDDRYESRAVLLLSPPSESRVQVSFTNDPDRYVIGQLSVLRSDDLAERVANEVGGGATTRQIERDTTIEHEPETDIVDVVVLGADPQRARTIADAYVDQYFESLQEQVSETRQPEIEALSTQLDNITGQLADVDDGIRERMAPFLPEDGVIADGAYAPIPGVDQVAPDLLSQKSILLSQYNEVLATRTELTQLDINAKLRVTSQVVQRATLPTEPFVGDGPLVLIAGLVGGAFLGLLLAVLAARLSRTALDVHEIEEVLGQPIVGEFPSIRALSKNRRAAVEALPHRAATFVDSVAVRAEAHAPVEGTFTVAVVGTERSAGSTTLAGALANRYASNGSQVILIDADQRDSELTRLFAAGRPGIPALLANRAKDRPVNRRSDGSRFDPFSPTAVNGLVVVGIGDKADSGGLRRQVVPDLLEAASRSAHVVVFDCGPVLDAASTLQLVQLVDAVVLAVPTRRLLTRTLSTIASQLQGRRGGLLPVLMPIARRRGPKFPSNDRPETGAALTLAASVEVESAPR
jgi:capsular polysaccharide biosynthesis protein/Mrp family chromosome partitioning ATPase